MVTVILVSQACATGHRYIQACKKFIWQISCSWLTLKQGLNQRCIIELYNTWFIGTGRKVVFQCYNRIKMSLYTNESSEHKCESWRCCSGLLPVVQESNTGRALRMEVMTYSSINHSGNEQSWASGSSHMSMGVQSAFPRMYNATSWQHKEQFSFVKLHFDFPSWLLFIIGETYLVLNPQHHSKKNLLQCHCYLLCINIIITELSVCFGSKMKPSK